LFQKAKGIKDMAIHKKTQENMDKAVANLHRELGTIRTGRASPALLERVMVEQYGTVMPLKQVANISVPDSQTLMIQAYDKSGLKAIEKGIMDANIGLTPNNDGSVIRVKIPALTEERRKEFIKQAKKIGEEAKVAIRNIRRDMVDEVKAKEKAKEITEDESKKLQDTVQKTTDKYIADVDKSVALKEKELTEV
jgi:ribosome recycling factor